VGADWARHGELAGGFIGGFVETELRRTAFWFVTSSLPLGLAGHLAVRAAGQGDAKVLGIIGSHVLATSVIGSAPVWAVCASTIAPQSCRLQASACQLALHLDGHGSKRDGCFVEDRPAACDARRTSLKASVRANDRSFRREAISHAAQIASTRH